ncbi:MAG: tRNA epoxyqueuosine(34) reductase QueG [Gloeomargaritaceae cyanobacterium C42_A2020_066]|nr:tRNA epoxyqueuosine(34) reductase QueG [Gloeomargaritaceae cyanobacterium C42_A2020_066]
MVTAAQVKHQAQALGFHRVGIAAAGRPPNLQPLADWVAAGHHADMTWMANSKRQDVQKVLPGVQSVICVALNYYSPTERPAGPDQAQISRYGWGEDYHRVMRRRLKALARWLQTQAPDCQTLTYSDTGPIAEKAWAVTAGLGWIGKHSNLITRDYGSWVFLGEVLTTLALEPDPPHTEHCGTCTRCLEACPTQAIVQPFVVDARQCIAYHTLENRAERLPPAIEANLEGWVAGCDICQDVCPWNQRFGRPTDVPELTPRPEHQQATLAELAHLSETEWETRFRDSALRRIKAWMWRRNAQAIQTHPEVESPESATCSDESQCGQ